MFLFARGRHRRRNRHRHGNQSCNGTCCLADLAVGQRGRVVDVHGDDEISLRLLEMGVTPGVDFSVLGTAPLGDPLELQIRGYRLSLRKTEAARIQVQPV